MNNIIFLDIDGVLNCEAGYKEKLCNYVTWGDEDKGEYHQTFYPPSKALINDLIKETDSKIVISSTWRSSGLEWLNKVWEYEKMDGEIVGVTPHLYFKNNYSAPRGCEIKEYLREVGFREINWSKEEQIKYMEESGIKNYIIIDDDSDMLYGQRNNFVHVEPSPRNRLGFNEKHYNKSLKILSKSILDLKF